MQPQNHGFHDFFHAMQAFRPPVQGMQPCLQAFKRALQQISPAKQRFISVIPSIAMGDYFSRNAIVR
jgi:hypothetical protein